MVTGENNSVHEDCKQDQNLEEAMLSETYAEATHTADLLVINLFHGLDLVSQQKNFEVVALLRPQHLIVAALLLLSVECLYNDADEDVDEEY